jgi:hypothetical protein
MTSLPQADVPFLKRLAEKATWWAPAALLWAHLAAWALPHSWVAAQLGSVPWWAQVALVAASFGLYVRLQDKPLGGCLGLLFGFLFYAPMWPLVVLYYVFRPFAWLFRLTTRESQTLYGSILPYVLTGVSLALLASAPHPYRTYTALILLAVDAFALLASLTMWISTPFPWGARALRFFVKGYKHQADSQAFIEAQDLAAARAIPLPDPSKTLKALKDLRDNLGRIAVFKGMFQDDILLVAFARKYFFSLVHLAVAFGLIHFSIGRLSSGTDVTYTLLSATSLRADLFEHVWFALMTLISGNSGILALTTSARVAVGFNALTGVALLILLITMFSLVSRERARTVLEEITTSFREITHAVERGLAFFLIAALGRPDASQQITGLLPISPVLPALTPDEQAAAHAAHRIHGVLVELSTLNRVSDAAHLAAAATRLDPQQLISLCPNPLDPEANTPQAILSRLGSTP